MALIFVLLKISNLSKRIDVLEENLYRKTNTSSNTTPSQAPVQNMLGDKILSTQTITTSSEMPINHQQAISKNSFDVLEWVKENWLLKLGVFLILLGFGWFVSYAFVHNWIGPVGRVVLGLVVGSLMVLFGTVRMGKNVTQGKLFIILGSALTVITLYAGHIVYDFFIPIILLTFVFLIFAYIAVIALQFNMKSLGVYGLVIAYVSPFFVTAEIEIPVIFSYLIIVSLASIWVAHLKEWRIINAVSVVGFMLHIIPNIMESIGYSDYITSGDKTFMIFSIFGMCLMYFLVSVYGVIKNNEAANQSDIVVAIFSSVLIIFSTMTLIDKEIQSLTLAAWLTVYGVGSFVVFTYTQKEKFFYVYSLIAVVLLVVATAFELEGSALVYAFIIEGAIISIGGYLITRKVGVGYVLSSLMVVPGIMSLPSIASNKWLTSVLHDDFGILFTIGTTLIGLGLFYYYSEKEAGTYNDTSSSQAYITLLITGSAFFLALVWLSAGALFAESGTSVLVSLVVYTLLGISMYFYGLVDNKNVFKYYGGTLLVCVVLRLLFVDVWDMELGARIITFILIGGLFISTAFLGNMSKNKEEVLIDNTK